MAKFRNWHAFESKAKLTDLKSISVVWGAGSIKIIARNSDDKKINILLTKDEAAILVARLTAGIHRII